MDFENRLGLTPTDLALRAQQINRPDDWVELTAETSPEIKLLKQACASEIITSRKFRDESTVWVRKEQIVNICRLLRDHPDTRYNFLSDLTCVDLLEIKGNTAPRFEIVYNLYSLTTFKRFRIKAQVEFAQGEAHVDTVESVWPAANWLEREVYDLFGVTFDNHSDLRRIQMPDDWIGHPLRKDFPLGGETVEFSFNVAERSGGG
jgi:NADH-quinone oxidoreductase subunit C